MNEWLGIDCGGNTTSVALFSNEELIAECSTPTVRASDQLLQLINQTRATLKNSWPISTIIITRGPGSFTGIRSGISTALGLSIGFNCPIVSVPFLLAQSYQAELPNHSLIISTAKASANDDYLAVYEVVQNGVWIERLTPCAVDKENFLEIEHELKKENKELIYITDQTTNPIATRAVLATKITCTNLQGESVIKTHKVGEPINPIYIKPVRAKTIIERNNR